MNFLPSERTCLFIDGANLYSASRNLGFDVDYRNLLEYFRKKAHVIRAYYYSAVLETEVQAQIPAFERLQQEVDSLRAEREQVRQRVERLLGQLDAMEL